MATTHDPIVLEAVTESPSALVPNSGCNFASGYAARWTVTAHSFPSKHEFGAARVEISAFRSVDGVMCAYSMTLPVAAAQALSDLLSQVLPCPDCGAPTGEAA